MITTSTATTNYYHFDPKFVIVLPPSRAEEIITWVREFCKGGYQIGTGWNSMREVRLQSESDYMHYLLRWK